MINLTRATVIAAALTAAVFSNSAFAVDLYCTGTVEKASIHKGGSLLLNTRWVSGLLGTDPVPASNVNYAMNMCNLNATGTRQVSTALCEKIYASAVTALTTGMLVEVQLNPDLAVEGVDFSEGANSNQNGVLDSCNELRNWVLADKLLSTYGLK